MNQKPSHTFDAARPRVGFAQLGVPSEIVVALSRQSITDPFPIQTLTLPDSLAGRHVLARGMTGSGKTLAFAIPTVARLAAQGRHASPRHPRALILVPTRELAAQVTAVITPIATALSLRSTAMYGGVGQGPQVSALRAGVDILIACPGRLEDLIAQGHCSLSHVNITVLDEADHMADLGFLPAVRRLLDATPTGGQRMLFSATLDGGVDVLVRRYIDNPVVHSLPTADAQPRIDHHVFAVTAADKPAIVREIANNARRVLLFTRTKHGARKLARQLSVAGISANELHGNLSQAARDRNLAAFAGSRTGVLVATDVAARGIHVDDIDIVVHVDPPADHKAYLHRSGRTARAGATGVVATLMTPDQKQDVHKLTRAAGISPTMTTITTGHPLLVALSGGRGQRRTPDRSTSGSTSGSTSRSTSRSHQARRRSRRRPLQEQSRRPAGSVTRNEPSLGGSATETRVRWQQVP